MTSSSIDLADLVMSASPVSQAVLVVLLLFSIFSWAVILYKWRLFRTVRIQDRRFLAVYEALDDPTEVRRRSATIVRSPMAELFAEAHRTALSHEGSEANAGGRGNGGVRRLERALRQISERQLLQEEEYLSSLATVGNVSPFVGLFGTVLGIIQAFQTIGRTGTASIAAVAPGVAEALVATAAGLLAAIPAVIAYNYFLTQIRRHATNLDVFRQDLIGLVESRVPGTSVLSETSRRV
ncbi:MAG: MotA/TolQ/ExbB proton channel family protein [Nitrospirota bacterium]